MLKITTHIKTNLIYYIPYKFVHESKIVVKSINPFICIVIIFYFVNSSFIVRRKTNVVNTPV